MNPLGYILDAPLLHQLALAALTVGSACVVTLPLVLRRMNKARHRHNRQRRKVSVAVALGFLAAAGCTLYSARASWVFARQNLHIDDVIERGALFAVGEIVLLALIFMARQNLNGPAATPGVYGLLAKIVVGVQILPAYAVGEDFVAGSVMAFFGPVMGMIMWHLMLGIELKHKKPDAESMSMWSQIVRELHQRSFAYLGLARRDRTALEIIQDRYLAKAVDHERTLELMTGKSWWTKRSRLRTEGKLDKAISRGIGGDAQRRKTYLALLNERRGAANLRELEMYDTWSATAKDMDREAFPEAHALSQQTATIVREGVVRASNWVQAFKEEEHPPLPVPEPPAEHIALPAARSALPKLFERMREVGIPLPPADAPAFSDIDPRLLLGSATPKTSKPPTRPRDEGPEDDPEPPAHGPAPDSQELPPRAHPFAPADRPPVKEPEPEPVVVGAGGERKQEEPQPKADPSSDIKAEAREIYKESARGPGETIKAKALAAKFGCKERWGYDRIREAKDEMARESAGRRLRAVD